MTNCFQLFLELKHFARYFLTLMYIYGCKVSLSSYVNMCDLQLNSYELALIPLYVVVRYHGFGVSYSFHRFIP